MSFELSSSTVLSDYTERVTLPIMEDEFEPPVTDNDPSVEEKKIPVLSLQTRKGLKISFLL